PAQDEQFDLRQLRQVDEGFDVGFTGSHVAGSGFLLWNRYVFYDVGDDGIGRQPVARGVRPEPYAVAEDERREFLDVLGVDLGAAVDQERPDFREAAPADDRAR